MSIEYEINQFWHQVKERHELDKTDELEFKMQKQVVLAKHGEELRAVRRETSIMAGGLWAIGVVVIVALASLLA